MRTRIKKNSFIYLFLISLRAVNLHFCVQYVTEPYTALQKPIRSLSAVI